jgi:hypothetical protein
MILRSLIGARVNLSFTLLQRSFPALPHCILSINIHRASKQMKFNLGVEEVRPTNDGSVMITYLNEDDKAINWLNGEFPFLSVEVPTRQGQL